MGRFGMLKCANNFSNAYGTKNCDLCAVVDDENHRINRCPKWGNVNRYHNDGKVAFADIYSGDAEKCLSVVNSILSIWDLRNGKNEVGLKYDWLCVWF